MSKIEIKKYDELYSETIAENTDKACLEKYNEFSSDDINLIFFDGVLAGWMRLNVPETSVYSPLIFIYVFNDFRRQGIGTEAYRTAEKKLSEAGCKWWTSYPPSDASDKFILSVGFDYVNTNYYMEHDGTLVDLNEECIRKCTLSDYPEALDIWDREYTDMHNRLGMKKKTTIEYTDEEKQIVYGDFCSNIDNYFVIEVENKIVGMGALFFDGTGIGALAVDAENKGRGYGTRLASFLTNESIRRGCKYPCLFCEEGNDDAMHIYKKIGYKVISSESGGIRS